MATAASVLLVVALAKQFYDWSTYERHSILTAMAAAAWEKFFVTAPAK